MSPTNRTLLNGSTATGAAHVTTTTSTKFIPVKKLQTLFDRAQHQPYHRAAVQGEEEGDDPLLGADMTNPPRFEPYLAGMTSCVVPRKKKTMLQLDDVVVDVMDSIDAMNQM
jgi:hypothetical protein